MKNNKIINNNKIIGILGGMGPDASNRLYEIMIEKSRSDYKALENSDYPNILLHSIPVPDFITNKKNAHSALKMLKNSVEIISPNAKIMGIACNTVHLFLEELEEVSSAPFVSMINEVVKEAKKYKKVGLLATPTTLKSNLYQPKLNNMIDVILPDEEQTKKLGEIVLEVVSGNINENIKETLINIADSMYDKGAEAIVLGCTELPLIFPTNYKINSISSLDVLAKSLLNKYYE